MFRSVPASPARASSILMPTWRTAMALSCAMLYIPATAGPCLSQTSTRPDPIATGAEVLTQSGFAALAGKRVGLITNQTGRVGEEQLADVLSKAPNVKLAAILAPEHGFRGAVEAGKRVQDGIDAKTGIRVFSLYGAAKKPTPAMLRNIDVLVFDVQDIGVRFYTYISTMGLAMQAAAAARIPFVVLDRPNPLGGDYVSGFVLERRLSSFVGQYPIPIVHGLTVGELAHMIKGERWLEGLDRLDLQVIEMRGWQRAIRWPQTGRPWVATSPNIPTFAAALVYPGMGLVGEAEINEGRGTPTPFSVFGAPWLDAARVTAHLNGLGLPGMQFARETFTPHPIAGVAARPRFAGKTIDGVRVVVMDEMRYEPLETGVHVLAALAAQARAKGVKRLFPNLAMLHALAGTKRLLAMLAAGSDGASIIKSWQAEVAAFKALRARYLLY
jgi:uncharacterized protein YbbC (DUF1343 family)